jgi:pyruvate dehydrogenase E1 component
MNAEFSRLRATAPVTTVDPDPVETQEWLESLDAVLRFGGGERAQFLLQHLAEHLGEHECVAPAQLYSSYRNSIPLEQQAAFPGDLPMEERIIAMVRWNALAMVMRANQAHGELGGHIASFASAAEIFEVGFQHFFRAANGDQGGDLVYLQPHSAPGIYARAFLEGRLNEDQLARYRQEIGGRGLCSYPHPWLMPDFWQFPTGSMGLGPLMAIYQARFLRYLRDRQLAATDRRHVWGVFGDGEMDEPEAVAGLTLAAREKLDNLTFIINCNLQRLDGPVRGNGQIIQELEALFTGAGWNVIKVLWGSDWDALFLRDTQHTLLRIFANTPDGEYQTLGAKDGEYNLAHFFQQDPELAQLVAHMSSAEIDALKRGGHDLRKLYAAFTAARQHRGRPTVILAKTKKGFGMGGAGESRMTGHQTKKLNVEALKAFRDRFHLPLSDAEVESLRFYRPAEDSRELNYLRHQRAALGGYLPARGASAESVAVPKLETYAGFALAADSKERSTTTTVVRLLKNLLRDPHLGPRVVPIVADEARTFGMAGLFKQVGIYSPVGQLYQPEDADTVEPYREAVDGQLLEEGITEAGALSSWVAAATSYSVHGLALLPVYIYYSMFGFQRVGDLIWAAADQRARGFLLGATAGRTTLNGEGLQHQDGSSHLLAAAVPTCRAYDPAFAGELAVIFDHGARQILEQQVDEFYYLTVTNENYTHATLPADAREAIIKGMYRHSRQAPAAARAHVNLLGSGAILREVIAAAERLAGEWDIASDVFSVTSFSELARDAAAAQRWNRLHPEAERRDSHVERLLAGSLLAVAATDYVRAYPQLIAPYVPGRYLTLGTDGFGRSDTRAALRRFFEVSAESIVLATLAALAEEGLIERSVPAEAIRRYGMDPNTPAPWTV